MSKIKLKKIKTIPFKINQEIDETLVDNITIDNVDDILEGMGYRLDKRELVGNVMVYYKSRRNGVYLSYEH